MTLKSAKVSQSVDSVVKKGTGYSVVSEISTDLQMVPNPGVTITIAGENRDHLDSSFTDRHVITLGRDLNSSRAYSITSDRMNPDFPIYDEKGDGGNCANFVSQSIYAGGLHTTRGNSFDVWNDSVWTWNLSGIARASHTWSGAQRNYNYMKDHSGAFTVESNAYNVGLGGVIYADWEGTGNLGHAMVVVGHINGGPHPSPSFARKL